MIDNKPQGLIYDGISLMQKGRLESASAIFDRAIASKENVLCAQFLDATCLILAADGADLNQSKKSYLKHAVDVVDEALAKLRNELDRVEQSEDTNSDF